MKLLFYQTLYFKLVDLLKDEFPESTQVRLVNLDLEDDEVIWNYAKDSGYTIVTQDADFYDIGLLKGSPPKVIWLRCGNHSTLFLTTLIKKNIESITEFLQSEEKFCLEIL